MPSTLSFKPAFLSPFLFLRGVSLLFSGLEVSYAFLDAVTSASLAFTSITLIYLESCWFYNSVLSSRVWSSRSFCFELSASSWAYWRSSNSFWISLCCFFIVPSYSSIYML